MKDIINKDIKDINNGKDIKNKDIKDINNEKDIINKDIKDINNGKDIKNKDIKDINNGKDIKNINNGKDITSSNRNALWLSVNFTHPTPVDLPSAREATQAPEGPDPVTCTHHITISVKVVFQKRDPNRTTVDLEWPKSLIEREREREKKKERQSERQREREKKRIKIEKW